MNLNQYILKLSLFLFLTFFVSVFCFATEPDEFPELDEELSELLINEMGELMNDCSDSDPDYPIFTDAHYRARLLEMSGDIQYRLTSTIKNHIIHRTEKYRSATERTLGLTDMYFPIFEEYLARKDVPHHLKYLPIVESNLNAVAKSHASAVGLWQFISGTGKLYGLKIASYLDERSDTHKASNAAATMLANLYKRYNDWPLALCAYNCGPGRVDKYVKGNDKKFWDIKHLLPRETQLYVPYFMAVAYSYEFHHLHELKPRRLPSDLVLTDTIHLEPGYYSLSQLSAKYKIGKDTLKRLNPGYIRNYVPSSSSKSILVLPARIVAGLRNYKKQFNDIMAMKTENPIKCIRRVNSEEELKFFMKAHRFSRNDLLFWNGLPSDYSVKQGDVIAVRKYFVPKDIVIKKKERIKIKAVSVPSLKVIAFDHDLHKTVTTPVYLNLKSKKLSQNVYSNAVTVKKNKQNNIPPLKTTKEETISEISTNRSRARRLRNNHSSPRESHIPKNSNSKAYKKPEMLAVKVGPPSDKEKLAKKTQKNKDLSEKNISKNSAIKNVTTLKIDIQSKEQAVIRAKNYSKRSPEESAALSELNKNADKLKNKQKNNK